MFILYSMTVFFEWLFCNCGPRDRKLYLTENQYVANKISRVKCTWHFGNCRI